MGRITDVSGLTIAHAARPCPVDGEGFGSRPPAGSSADPASPLNRPPATGAAWNPAPQPCSIEPQRCKHG